MKHKTKHMITFLEKSYNGEGKEQLRELTYPSFDAAKSVVHRLFNKEDWAVRYEEAKLVSGKQTFCIKNRNNKIIYQLKQL